MVTVQQPYSDRIDNDAAAAAASAAEASLARHILYENGGRMPLRRDCHHLHPRPAPAGHLTNSINAISEDRPPGISSMSYHELPRGTKAALRDFCRSHRPPCNLCGSSALVKFRFFNNPNNITDTLQPRFRCRNPACLKPPRRGKKQKPERAEARQHPRKGKESQPVQRPPPQHEQAVREDDGVAAQDGPRDNEEELGRGADHAETELQSAQHGGRRKTPSKRRLHHKTALHQHDPTSNHRTSFTPNTFTICLSDLLKLYPPNHHLRAQSTPSYSLQLHPTRLSIPGMNEDYPVDLQPHYTASNSATHHHHHHHANASDNLVDQQMPNVNNDIPDRSSVDVDAPQLTQLNSVNPVADPPPAYLMNGTLGGAHNVTIKSQGQCQGQIEGQGQGQIEGQGQGDQGEAEGQCRFHGQGQSRCEAGSSHYSPPLHGGDDHCIQYSSPFMLKAQRLWTNISAPQTTNMLDEMLQADMGTGRHSNYRDHEYDNNHSPHRDHQFPLPDDITNIISQSRFDEEEDYACHSPAIYNGLFASCYSIRDQEMMLCSNVNMAADCLNNEDHFAGVIDGQKSISSFDQISPYNGRAGELNTLHSINLSSCGSHDRYMDNLPDVDHKFREDDMDVVVGAFLQQQQQYHLQESAVEDSDVKPPTITRRPTSPAASLKYSLDYTVLGKPNTIHCAPTTATIIKHCCTKRRRTRIRSCKPKVNRSTFGNNQDDLFHEAKLAASCNPKQASAHDPASAESEYVDGHHQQLKLYCINPCAVPALSGSDALTNADDYSKTLAEYDIPGPVCIIDNCI